MNKTQVIGNSVGELPECHRPIIDNRGFLRVGPMKIGKIVFKEGTPLLEVKNHPGRKTRGYGEYGYSTVEDLIELLRQQSPT